MIIIITKIIIIIINNNNNTSDNNNNSNNRIQRPDMFFKDPGCPQEIVCIMLFSGTIIALITTIIILKHHYQRHKPATHPNILISKI